MVTASAALGSPWACSTAMRSAGSRVSANPIHQHGRHSICHSDAIAHEDTKGRQRSATRSALVGSRRLRGRGALRGIGRVIAEVRDVARVCRHRGHVLIDQRLQPIALGGGTKPTTRTRGATGGGHRAAPLRAAAHRGSRTGRTCQMPGSGTPVCVTPGAQWKASTRYQTGAAAARA